MALLFRAAGTAVNGQTGTITPPLPAGTATDDGLELVVMSGKGANTTAPSVATPTGWTERYNSAAITTGRLQVFTKNQEAGGVAPDLTISDGATGNTAGVTLAAIVGYYSDVSGSLPEVDVVGVHLTPANPPHAHAEAITPTGTDRMISFVIGGGDNATWSTYSGTDPVFTEQLEVLTPTGSDACLAVADGVRAAATSTGDRTAQTTFAFVAYGLLVAWKEQVGAAPAPANIIAQPYTRASMRVRN